LEMALGEGLVLTIFYALASTVDHAEIRSIIESAIVDEEKHVVFGERETAAWLRNFPADRKALLAQALLQWMAMRKLRNYALKKLPKKNPVLAKFPVFYDHTLAKFESRVLKLGLSDRPLREISPLERAALLISLPFRTFWMRRTRPKRLLTSVYLADPWVRDAGASSAELSPR